MGFDFQAAVSAAQAIVDRQENGGGGVNYKYPLVYPQSGNQIVVRPLFNPKSGQIVRLVQRHEKVACYRTYGIECPICKAQQQVKDMTGQDPFGRTSASKSRGICFAQYISSTYQITKGDNGGMLQPGELILFMFPWSVYTQINTIIQAASQSPTGMDQAFSHAQSGMFIQVTVTKDFKYTTTNVPYMTFPTTQSDEDFIKMLNEMDSLADQVLPATITEEVAKQVQEYAESINRQYIAPRVPNQAPYVPQVTQFNSTPPAPPQQTTGYPPYNNPTSVGPTPPTYQQTTPQQSTPYYPPVGTTATVPASLFSQQSQVASQNWAPQQQGPAAPPPEAPGVPACFGAHKENDPKCICCPCEVTCMDDQYPF